MAADYIATISSMGWDELSRLWEGIEARDTPGWPDGKAFEYLILRCFQLSGAQVTWPYSVHLNGEIVEQIDGMIVFDHFICLVEAKDRAAPIGVEPIAKPRNQLLRRPAGIIGSVFGLKGFTDAAQTLAQYTPPQAILLWAGWELDYLLPRKSFKDAFVRKFEYHAMNGIPDLDTRAEVMR
jgi:hypothetical protein